MYFVFPFVTSDIPNHGLCFMIHSLKETSIFALLCYTSIWITAFISSFFH